MEERLQKILARAGYGSRRSTEELIAAGRVTVNGQVAVLGLKADPERDEIRLDGQLVRPKMPGIYLALNKPKGVISDGGEKGDSRRTVFDLVGYHGHLFPIGRLDANSEGLVLLTDDGQLAYRLSHPRFEHSKEYQVLVEGRPPEDTLESWRKGVYLEGRRTAPAEVSVLRYEGTSTWLRVVLREGRKRQIRHVAAILGHPVRRLIRVRIGPVELGDLESGNWRHLSKAEKRELLRAAARPAPNRGLKGASSRKGD